MQPQWSVLLLGNPELLGADTPALLAQAGGRLHSASTLLQALQLGKSMVPDVVVIDLGQSGPSGLIALKRLKEQTGRRHLGVTVITASDDPHERIAALEAGADDVFTPPVLPMELALRLGRRTELRRHVDGLLDEVTHLNELSLTDSLTGVPNRRSFQERLNDEFLRAQRYQDSLGLVLLDLDHFKVINDTHGHPGGDVVLREVAGCLRLCVRETDFIARYGGEEFALLLPKTEIEGAHALAERVRFELAALVTQSRSQITGSLGLAIYPGPEISSAEALLRAADLALYEAKRRGRNQVVPAPAAAPANVG
jgi:two-component system cell cycle response regulator